MNAAQQAMQNPSPLLSDLGCKPVNRAPNNMQSGYWVGRDSGWGGPGLSTDWKFINSPIPAPIHPDYITAAYPQPQRNPMQRRLVTVVISDPHQKDIDEAVLFHDTFAVKGTDEDVFHEIGISMILDTYNQFLEEQWENDKDKDKPKEPRQVRMSQLKKQIIKIADL